MSAFVYQIILIFYADNIAKPQRSRRRVVCNDIDQFFFCEFAAAFIHFFCKLFGAVFNAFFLLQPIVRAGKFGIGQKRIAAEDGHFFDKDNFRAVRCRFDRGRQTRAASPDNDNIGRLFYGLSRFNFCFFRLKRGDISARLFDRICNGLQNRFGRKSRAAHRIDGQTLRFNNLRMKKRQKEKPYV